MYIKSTGSNPPAKGIQMSIVAIVLDDDNRIINYCESSKGALSIAIARAKDGRETKIYTCTHDRLTLNQLMLEARK